MSAEIRQRIAEIEAELFSRSAYFDTSILKPADPVAQVAREKRREALNAERESLLRQLPVTGERAGHMVMNRTLGTVIVRESSYDEPPEKFDRSNPFERFADEMGWKS
jgi:hypothetical protein